MLAATPWEQMRRVDYGAKKEVIEIWKLHYGGGNATAFLISKGAGPFGPVMESWRIHTVEVVKLKNNESKLQQLFS